MEVRAKPGGRLAELKADLQGQKRRQEMDDGETHPVYKYQGTQNCIVVVFEPNFHFISLSQAIPLMF